MRRYCAIGVILVFGHAALAGAGETIIGAGSRYARALGGAPEVALQSNAAAAPLRAAGQAATLESSSLKRRSKLLIGFGAGIAFAAAVWKIDHSVLDVTPSSLGTRQD